MSDYSIDYPIGKINHVTAVNRLGSVFRFANIDYDTAGLKNVVSGMYSYARLVKNGSGGTLKAGDVCYWDIAGKGPGMEVDGAAAIASNNIPAGVVDPYISTTVADAETFLLFYYGPAKFLFTTGTSVAIGDNLTLGAAGRVDVFAVATADAENQLHHCGTSLATVASATASDTTFDAFIKMPFSF
jgi:hypothetical protein